MNNIKVEDILDVLELANDDTIAYYHKVTGEIVHTGEEERRIAERCSKYDLDKYPEWQREIIEAAIDIEENFDDYISLPTAFDINEYNIMREFCDALDNDRISNQLFNALHGNGAFRRFKDAIIRLDVEQKWYDFRDKALKQIAIDWCEENRLEMD